MAKTKRPKYRATYVGEGAATDPKAVGFMVKLMQHIDEHGLAEKEDWRKRPRKKVLTPPASTGRKPPDQTEE